MQALAGSAARRAAREVRLGRAALIIVSLVRRSSSKDLARLDLMAHSAASDGPRGASLWSVLQAES